MTRSLRTLLLLLFCLAALLGPHSAQAGGALSISLSAQPNTVSGGGEIVYTLSIANAGSTDLTALSIRDTLPAGFTYRSGSASITLDGAHLGAVEPTISGQSLTWANLRLPAARTGTVYGMNTFFQDRCDNAYIDDQLNHVLQVAGSGAYVKQLLYGIVPSTSGPQSCWIHFVSAAYDRGLIPVVRLEGPYGGTCWLKPQADHPGDYSTIAQAFKRVVAGLPLRSNLPLYVEIWNEPNLGSEWGGSPNPVEYAQFLVAVSSALRSLNDPRIVILNGALSPGGDYNSLSFIDAMATVPGAMQAFDVWATHPYPGSHPPQYNIHNGTAAYSQSTIDSYLLEIDRLATHGRTGLHVLLTETGYALGANDFAFEGYPPINESNRADYISRAWRDYWSHWPEVLGVCPFELVDPYNGWGNWDWLYTDGRHHAEFDSVAGLDKTPSIAASTLVITFRATAGLTGGSFSSAVNVLSSTGAILASAQGLAPVTVLSLTPTPTPTTGPSPTPNPSCTNVLRNGGFEANTSDWQPMGGVLGDYSTRQVHSGTRSFRLGLESDPPYYSFSSVEQELTLPANSATATLSFWYRVVSNNPSGGQAYVLIRDANQAFHTLGNLNLSAQDWTRVSFDTSAYIGQTVAVRMTTVNGTTGGAIAVYIDDATWTVCPSTSPPPTPSPTPTARPSPTATPGCVEAIRDGGFEVGTGWTLLDTAYPAAYTTSPVHSGHQALRVGIAAGADVYSYSSAEQSITIPADASLARLSFWVYPQSADQSANSNDVQYLLLLDEGGGSTSLMWEHTNATGWQQREISLDAYRGQQVTLRFGVRNDGNGATTVMYVDDVSLTYCVGAISTPPVYYGTPQAYLPLIARTTTAAQALQTASTGTVTLETVSSSASIFRAIASDPESGQVYAVADDGVWAFAPANRARRLLAGHGYQCALMDLSQRRLLVSDWEGGRVLALDLDDGHILAQAQGLLHPSGLALFDNHIFVAETGADRIVVLDRRTCGIMKNEPVGAAPFALATDAVRGRIWVANAGGDTVTVLDAHDGVPIGAVRLDGLGHPLGIAVDGQRGRVYLTYEVTPRYHGLAVVQASTLEIERVVRGSPERPLLGAYGIAVEPATGRILLTDVQGLLSLDPQTGSADTVLPDQGFASPFGLTVGADGRLFIAGQNALGRASVRIAHMH